MVDTYHHGRLREHLLSAAADEIARNGPETLSLRELARRAGVTHGAPAHHFGSRRGLFTALAMEGFEALADALAPSVERGEFVETAVAYVRFALEKPGHYAVMFRPDLLEETAGLREQRDRAAAALTSGMATLGREQLRTPEAQARQAAWGLVHGIASLFLSGALGDTDPLALARAGAWQLFGSVTSEESARRPGVSR
ncbi:TetR/AcrR family transcriptional regulator [Microbacterium luticocti]|uniref:TetR/AcrR family transcriptional regulator n=1 Tax=Microbacterium luticocti TaxID=451764 RepID=UPI000416C16D|nr:TetR/AcrR family transcriptional regulator [Microbacterium luticocti]